MAGRVDPVLLGLADEVGIDHAGCLKEREVQFLLDTPNYNRDPQLWSLERLNSLKPGEEVSHGGVTFSRMEIDRSTLERASQAEAGQWRWFTGEDGIIRLHWFLVDLIQRDYHGSYISSLTASGRPCPKTAILRSAATEESKFVEVAPL